MRLCITLPSIFLVVFLIFSISTLRVFCSTHKGRQLKLGKNCVYLISYIAPTFTQFLLPTQTFTFNYVILEGKQEKIQELVEEEPLTFRQVKKLSLYSERYIIPGNQKNCKMHALILYNKINSSEQFRRQIT